MQVEINNGITTTGNGTAQFYVNTQWRVTSVTISAYRTLTQEQIEAGNTATLAIKLSDGTNSYTTNTVTVNSNDKKDYTFSVSFAVEEFSTLSITTIRTNCETYWDATTATFPGGYLSSSSCYDMAITYEYTKWWTMDGSNDGYPHIDGMDVVDFVYFEQDENGYPYNQNVWKFDTNNDGYPWIVGFEQSAAVTSTVMCKTEDGLVACNVFLKTDTGLQVVGILPKE